MKKLIIALSVLLCSNLLLVGCKEQSYFEAKEETEVETEASEETKESKSQSLDKIYVQVSGAVKHPGVFELLPNARVFEAIEAAGGLLENADETDLNQAALLEDGQKIYVYTIEEKELERVESTAEISGYSESGLLNINTATKEDLMTLSGIGESKAEAIISYREKNGGFSAIEDLKNIPGIKDGVYSKIADQICIN
ncbi:MAG: ComEA family DNA-binding protein [Lachnospiraceae bacterium]|nr:ComEA family DNA-binding protein [Lachnospiraceae bacterium]